VQSTAADIEGTKDGKKKRSNTRGVSQHPLPEKERIGKSFRTFSEKRRQAI
jgi:hypothetical protein